jgi:type IV pilus assembly protein PilV
MLKNQQTSFVSHQEGFTLLEVLVSLVILMIGLLGMAGLIVNVQKADMDSYQRRQAVILLQDMVNRMNANRRVASCYVITTSTTTGTPFMGVGSTVTPACVAGSSGEPERAIADLTAWDSALKGAAETHSGSNVGVMIGARGCITNPSAGIYRISVAWQGTGDTFSPPTGVDCAKNLYGTELRRRVISAIVTIPDLSA